MANILPPERRHVLTRNYYVRVSILASIVFASMMMFGLVALAPSYFAGQTQHKEATLNLALQKQLQQATKANETEAAARKVSTEIKDVLRAQEPSKYDVVQAVLYEWVFFADTIAITTISVEDVEKKIGKKVEVTTVVRISGVAHDRATLNAFVQALRKTTEFSEVSLPLADFVETTNIDFSLSMNSAL